MMMKLAHRWRKMAVLWGGLWCFAPLHAQEATVPLLRNVGIIPAQWNDAPTDLDWKQPLVRVEGQFVRTVRESKRFQRVNDEVVKDLWSTKQGRQELQSNYELHGFISLVGSVIGDSVQLSARILGPNLETYLVESSTVSQSAVLTASDSELQKTMQTLIYGLMNRMPYDVTVSSLQGRYITVTGGSEQGVNLGDELDVNRVTIASIHPATHAWYRYSSKALGKIKIVEVKSQSAVGEILNQNYEAAIKIGDGARVPNSPTRRFFGGEKAPLEQPSDGDLLAAKEASLTTLPAKAEPSANPIVPKKAGIVDDTTSLHKESDRPAPEPVPSAPADQPSESLNLGKEFKNLTLGAGHRFWSASGSGSADAELPMWIFNHFSARLTRDFLMPEMSIDYILTFDYGPTAKGDAMGFGAGVEPSYGFATKMFGAQEVRVGATGTFESLGVTRQTFGGYDLMQVSAFVALVGDSNLGYFPKPVQWEGRFAFVPYASGKVGAKGGKKDVDSVTDYTFQFSAIVPGEKAGPEWGGTGWFNTREYGMGKKTIYFQDLYLGALARYKF